MKRKTPGGQPERFAISYTEAGAVFIVGDVCDWRLEMSGKLRLEVRAQQYELSGPSVQKLAESLKSSLAGGIVVFRLDQDAKPAKVLNVSSFRFLTKRGAERLSKPDQKQLLSVAESVLLGEDRRWPNMTFVTVTHAWEEEPTEL